ncbi:hypothetical protein [Ligilactobacillus salivarius]|uniref:Uncharacterized protein n=1 Tax=Ligilactobacillus salivarius TaxID=1624 RepID=A0AAX3XAD3_9LACO|nr:hypothetical protein [Ligilactobacillus salivarius]WII29735.1 hypothetical protein QFE45_10735 [Ligilactobacillus salivarius]
MTFHAATDSDATIPTRLSENTIQQITQAFFDNSKSSLADIAP